MPLKAIPITATASGLINNTNIADMDLQVVIIGQLQIIVNQLTGNKQVLENKINKMGITKIKIPLVKKFNSKKAKLKKFLI